MLPASLLTLPPHTMSFEPVHTALPELAHGGAPAALMSFHSSRVGEYRSPRGARPGGSPHHTSISVPVHAVAWFVRPAPTRLVAIGRQRSNAGSYRPPSAGAPPHTIISAPVQTA